MKKITMVLYVLLAGWMSASAAVFTADFDIGLGYNKLAEGGTVEGWNDLEPGVPNANTYVGGDFTLTISHTVAGFSSLGPTFTNRVLGVGDYGDLAGGADVIFTIEAEYTGSAAPLGATPIKLVIDSISINSMNHSNHSTGTGPWTIAWSETTPGNTDTSPAVDLGIYSTALGDPPEYDQLVWNPADVAIAGTSTVRTFGLALGGGLTAAAVDGFEIVGHIEYEYDPHKVNFDIGLGYNKLAGGGTVEGWNDFETSNVNTYVTGDFTMEITHTVAGFSSAGPQFPNRVLAGSGTYAGGAGVIFTIDTKYAGSDTAYVATPMRFVIDEISIYAFNHSTHGDGVTDTIAWSETTAGNAGLSPALNLGATSTALSNPAEFDQLVWDPADIAVSGTNSVRTFELTLGGTLANAAIDGLEIRGHVEYDTSLPELGDIAAEALPGTNGLIITWTTESDFSYALEDKSELTDVNWTTNTTVDGTGGDVSVTAAVDRAEAFFRVVGSQIPVSPNTDFSIGLGYNDLDGTEGWDDAETASVNTYAGGDFTLEITHTAAGFSSAGPQFPNRVLAGSGSRCGAASVIFTVAAEYTGSETGVGSTPMKLVIDSISVYAFNHSAHGDGLTDTIAWSETTAGNTGSSSALNLGATSTALSNPAEFDQLVWDPADLAVSGTNSVRTFELALGGTLTAAALDGFEIVGHIEYDTIP